MHVQHQVCEWEDAQYVGDDNGGVEFKYEWRQCWSCDECADDDGRNGDEWQWQGSLVVAGVGCSVYRSDGLDPRLRLEAVTGWNDTHV